MCMWADLDVLWRRCRMIYTMYERGKEVMSE